MRIPEAEVRMLRLSRSTASNWKSHTKKATRPQFWGSSEALGNTGNCSGLKPGWNDFSMFLNVRENWTANSSLWWMELAFSDIPMLSENTWGGCHHLPKLAFEWSFARISHHLQPSMQDQGPFSRSTSMHTVGIPVHRLGGSTLQWTLRELAPLTLRKRSGWEHTLAKTHGTTMHKARATTDYMAKFSNGP